MNILSLLKPKAILDYIYDDFTVRQALEKLKNHNYTAIPMINRDGEYVDTITEGDFLRYMLHHDVYDMRDLEHVGVTDMEKIMHNKPVYITSTMEDLILLSMEQNFVPVIDDRNIFSGIVTRRDILQFCYNTVQEVEIRRMKENNYAK